MTHEKEILERLDRIEDLLRSLWEDQQLDRIEDDARHIRHVLAAKAIEEAAISGTAFIKDGKLLKREDVFVKPAPASPVDPQARRTDRA